MRINYSVLGPLEVMCDGQRVDVGTGKQRILLALLLLHGNERLSSARLVDLLWDEPPPSAGKILQNCVMRLRRVLPDGSLITYGSSYELQIGQDDLDANRFTRLLEQGRAELGGGDPASAAQLLDSALAEWRGAPLSDVGEAPFVDEAVRRLEGLRLGARADRGETALALGRHREVVEELDALVAEHPLQERLRAQLMLALYRNGRQAEALEVYREGRRALVEQLGVEPAPELRQLEQAILRQAPELDAPIGAPPRTWRGVSRAWSRNAVLAAAATLLVGAIALLAVGLVRGPSGTSTSGIPPNSVAVIDAATARSTADLPVGQAPSSIAVSDNSVWVLNQLNATLTRIDALHQRIAVTAIPLTSYVNAALTSIAVADGAVWAVDSGESSLTRVGISPREVVHVALPGWARYSSDYMTLATGAGQLWITSSHLSSVLEADQRSGQVASRIAVPGYPSAAAFGGGAVWCIAAEHGGGLVARIDPATHRVVASIPLLGTPTALATGFSAVWVAIANRNLLYKIDESTNAVVRTIAVRGAPVAVAVGAGGVWVVAGQRRRLIRIDPASGATTATVALNGTPHALAVADGRVWVLGA